MSAILFYLAFGAILLTTAVLAVGIGGFGSKHRGGAEGARFSNRLMRYRILAQFAAVVLLMLMVWAAKSGW